MTTAPPPAADKAKDAAHSRDPVREAVETVVFVVTLVLLLKLFVVEAFVIPTGSMAETLYGYQKIVDCPQCGFEFPVNSHDEVEPNKAGERMQLVGYCCPNCRFKGDFRNRESPSNRTGDRVLVLKPIYHATAPQRGDVVVFKYPEAPQENHTAANYIKRAKGFGGETIAIFRGDLFATRSLTYPADAKDEYGQPLYPRPDDPKDLWRPRYTYNTASYGNPLAVDLFDKSFKAGFPTGDGFEIVRKPDDQVLASKRIVWDNDHQPKDLKG